MKTVMGLFVHSDELAQAVHYLGEAGFAKEQLGLLAGEETVEQLLKQYRERQTAEGAGWGAAGGGLLGGFVGLLAVAGSLAIPPLGAAVAAGTLASILGTTAAGAGLGALYGGITGALSGRGLAQEHINIYEHGLESGGMLLSVHAPSSEEAQTAQQIMLEANGTGVAVYDEDEVEEPPTES